MLDLVFLNCRISQGAFSGERVFEITQADGKTYAGLSSWYYCYHLDGNPLKGSEPGEDKTINGKITARRIAVGTDTIRVVVPDGQTIFVPSGAVSDRPIPEARHA